ncbi:HAD family hydrolase [Bacteroidota bacterium]
MTYRLICFDMDGVLLEDMNFWIELHRRFGTYEEGKKLTEKYVSSDYEKLVREVPERLWKGRDASPYYELVNSIKYMDGVREVFAFIKKHNLKTAIISGGSLDVAKRVQKDFGVNYIYANHLVTENNKVTGEYYYPVREGYHFKAQILRDLCKKLNISTKEVIYIGDSKFDKEAFKEVGLSIAFNCNDKELKKVASIIVDSKKLSDIIKVLPSF